MTRFVRIISLLMLGMLVLACDPGTSATPEDAAPVEWSLTEILRLGTFAPEDAGPAQFGAIASVAMDSENRVYVLDGQDQEIRVFRLSGEFSHSIGRPGSGPGEFEFARSMALSPGDTLVVRDDGAMRYSVFAPGGDLLGTHRRDIVGTNGGARPEWVDGRYVDWAPATPDGRFGSRFQLLPIAFTPEFERADSLAPIEHRWEMLPNDMPMTSYASAPLGALSPNGDVWAAESGVYAAHLRSPAGDTIRSVSLEVDALPVGPEEIASIEERFERSPEYLGHVLEALPAEQPPLALVTTDPAGRLYMFPNTSDRAFGTGFDVFSPDGEHVASVDLPASDPVAFRDAERIRVYEDHIVLVRRDALDVPYVVVYEIERSR